MKKSTIWIALALGLLVAVAATVWTVNYRRSPRYALGQIREAIEERNALKFEGFVDVERLSEEVVGGIITSALSSALAETEGDLAALGAALGGAFANQMRPMLTERLRTTLIEAVETGGMDSVFAAASAGDEDEVRLATLVERTGVDPTGFQGLTQIQREGNVAIVGFEFASPLMDTTVVLRMRMERSENRWKLVAPYEFSSFLEKVSQRQQYLIDEAKGAMLQKRVQGQLRSLIVKRDDVRVRNGPGTDYRVVSIAAKGDTILAGIRNSGWRQVLDPQDKTRTLGWVPESSIALIRP